MARRSSFFSDFKAFINQGNVVGLAVAVVIGIVARSSKLYTR